MKVLTNRVFKAWAKQEHLSSTQLIQAAREIEQGLIDATLGRNLFKKRVAVRGRGKRGGARVVLAYRYCDRLVMLYGFSKNEKDNITQPEKQALAELGRKYLDFSEQEITTAIKTGILFEVRDEK